MTSTLRSTLLWAVAAVGAGAVIWWLLDQGSTAGIWLLAAFLAAHGAVHLLFLVPAPEGSQAPWAFHMARSWVVTRLAVDAATVRAIGLGLIGLVVAGFVLAGLSTVGLIVPTEWWQPVVAASALVSTLLLALYLDGQLIVGLGINAVLLWVVLAGLWMP